MPDTPATAETVAREIAEKFRQYTNWPEYGDRPAKSVEKIAVEVLGPHFQRLAATQAVADTLLARRNVEKEILSFKMKHLPENTRYWNDLMVRERDARVANDQAVAEYRKLPAAPGAAATETHNG